MTVSQPNILVLALWRWNFVGYRQIAAICTEKSLHTTETGRKCENVLEGNNGNVGVGDERLHRIHKRIPQFF